MLQDIDLAENNLVAVPDALYKLKKLRKLDLSANKITNISIPEGTWEGLETLNVSCNQLTALPAGIVRCLQLKRLYASENLLTFEGKSRLPAAQLSSPF